jgi:hypothetical protein
MIRSIVLDASIVCRVESTRCPVSAASKAISVVSKSRISPMRITFGAWRNVARKAEGKSLVSCPTSRWLMVELLCECKYSIGSSIVTTW